MFGPMAVAQAPAADGYNLNEAISTHLWKVQRGQGLPVAEKADSVPLERVLNHFHHAIYLRHAQHAHLVHGHCYSRVGTMVQQANLPSDVRARMTPRRSK